MAALVLCAGGALAQAPAAEFDPQPGLAGKDVIWVPTPPSLVEKMLDMLRIGPDDFVMDLGSGDGRNVIAAARRGARALGVEYNPDMVALARRRAAEAGVAERATFVQGDMFEADVSKATALALFLLPDNLKRLQPGFRKLAPGTRVVNNGYRIPGWEEAEVGTAYGDCGAWCTAYLYIVPANIEGAWRLPAGEVRFEQDFQALSGMLGTQKLSGEVRGERVRFTIGLDEYTGRVSGERMSGEVRGARSGYWAAERIRGQSPNSQGASKE